MRNLTRCALVLGALLIAPAASAHGMHEGYGAQSDEGEMQGMMGPGMMQPGMMGPGMMQPGMMGPGMMQPGMMGPGMMQPGMMGPGMMGYGTMGRGMMGPGMMGYGMMGRGMMGPGMMGYGMMGPGMMGHGGMGYGMMGPGMMGPGMYGDCPRYGAYGPPPRARDLSVDEVRHMMSYRLDAAGNPNLKLGDVKERDADAITADVVTKDGSLVRSFVVDRHTGAMWPADKEE